MSQPHHGALGLSPVSLLLTMFIAFVYLRGWLHLRTTSLNVIEAWRAGSFVLVPAGPDTFLVEGKSDIRVRFTLDSAGRAVKLTILGPAGPQGESPRNP